MKFEQCEKCQYFCIEYNKNMGWHYQVCKNPEYIELFNSKMGVRIELINDCKVCDR